MKYIIGNFKNKPDKTRTTKILKIYDNELKQLKTQHVSVGFCVQKEYYKDAVKIFKRGEIFVCNLDISDIKTNNYKAVLLGHSDFRAGGESSSLILKKVKLALSLNIKVILCVGETFEENEKQQTLKVLKKQIKGLNKLNRTNLIIAYEPVYAISTAKNYKEANFNEVLNVINFLQTNFNNPKFSRLPADAAPVSVLYGGSVNETNAEKFLTTININGVLIGAASLMPEKFIQVIATGKRCGKYRNML